MKRILFFIAISTLTLASCSKESGVGSSLDDFSLSSSSSSSTPVAVSAVPQSAKNLIATRYTGYSIKEVQKELEHGATIYKIAIVSGKAKIVLIFDANWNFLSEKN